MGGELTGKVAIVTGGASGIGRGCVPRFVDAGAQVVIADVNTEAGEALAVELGADAAFKETDVADADSVTEVVAFAVERNAAIAFYFAILFRRDDHVDCAHRAQATFSSFWMQRTTGGIGVSGKLVFQLVTPTSPT